MTDLSSNFRLQMLRMKCNIISLPVNLIFDKTWLNNKTPTYHIRKGDFLIQYSNKIFEILYNNKNPMSISGLWKKSHSRYETICAIVESYPNIFKIIKIDSNRKLVNLNRESKSFEKFLEILNNLRYVEQINITSY